MYSYGYVYEYIRLLYGFSKFPILIGWQAVRRNSYPGNFALQIEKIFAFQFSNLNLQIKISNNQIVFEWACMSTMYCCPVKLMIADQFNSREKHMLKYSIHPYNKQIISLACSVYSEISDFCFFLHWPRFFATRSILGLIFQYRLHAGAITLYYVARTLCNTENVFYFPY